MATLDPLRLNEMLNESESSCSLAPDLQKLLQGAYTGEKACKWDLAAVGMDDLKLDQRYYVGHLLGGGAEFKGEAGAEEVGTVYRQFETGVLSRHAHTIWCDRECLSLLLL